MLTFADLVTGLGSHLLTVSGDQAITIQRAVADSRLCRAGDLFAALPGESMDGAAFIEDALARGATAVLTSRGNVAVPEGRALFQVTEPLPALQALAGWWRGRFELDVVAITGTTGKTSTKEITAHVLGARGESALKTEASLNGDIGLPLMLLRLRPEHEVAVLELGLFYAGEITLQCDLAKPQFGIVTNVGYTHAERLGSIDAIAKAKQELVDWLPTESVVALNADDPRVAAMVPAARGRVVSYGLDPARDVTAADIRDLGLDGLEFRIVAGGATARVRTPLIGRHNVGNCLAATAIAMARCMTLPEIAESLETATNPLRLKTMSGPGGSTLIDDTYNANPASMAAALDVLAAVPGRKVAVLGDMLELGEEEERLHHELGERAATVADVLHFVGPRARWSAAAACGVGRARVVYHENTKNLADALRGEIGAGDVVLLKASRGLALERVVSALRADPDVSPALAAVGSGALAEPS